MAAFERSKKDVESKKYGKEGSRKEEAFDKRQAAKGAGKSKGKVPAFMKKK